VEICVWCGNLCGVCVSKCGVGVCGVNVCLFVVVCIWLFVCLCQSEKSTQLWM